MNDENKKIMSLILSIGGTILTTTGAALIAGLGGGLLAFGLAMLVLWHAGPIYNRS